MNKLIDLFFPTFSNKKIAYLRVALGIAIFLHIYSWIGHIDQMFLSFGYLPIDKVKFCTPSSCIHFLEYFSDLYIWIFYIILFISNLFLILGILPRASLVLIYVIFSAFIKAANK